MATSGGEGVCDPFRVVMWFVWWTFSGAVVPGYVTSALSGRVQQHIKQHIQDLPGPMQHLLRTRHMPT
jgi:hypothetical protein